MDTDLLEASTHGPAKDGAAADRFTGSLGVILATLGSAVGLGNIWKFPYLTGANGGAAFLIVYIISTLLVGLPVMISEHMIGRTARAEAIHAFMKLNPGKKTPWWLIGAFGVVAAFFIMAFYTEVAGWVLFYVFKSLGSGIFTTDTEVTIAAFSGVISNPWLSLAIQWVVLTLIGLIIMQGVSKGIERTAKRVMPVLLVLLIIVAIRSLTLEGAGEGIKFLFQPDFSKLTGAVVLTAMGLAFFKLSIGMGAMITYGSYYTDDQNIPANAVRVMLGDLTVSILAGLAIFPAVFAYGVEPGAGASLLFITIPTVFASMPLGHFFMVIFFVLTFLAAVGAMLSLVEVLVAYLVEQFKISRKKSTLFVVLSLAAVGSLASLSNSLLADTKLLGMTFFDFFDYVSSNVLLPVGGLFIVIFIGWAFGWKRVEQALTNSGKLKNGRLVRVFFFITRYVTPLLVLVVLLNGFGVFGK
ncbi:MAG: sodium-dependent transporter [Bellilinea sp.]